MTLLLAFLIGVFAGLRSLTAPAVVAWAVHLGRLRLVQPLAHIDSAASVTIFTILAVAELIADKLPKTPSRTAATVTRPASARHRPSTRTQPKAGADRVRCRGRWPAWPPRGLGSQGSPTFRRLR